MKYLNFSKYLVILLMCSCGLQNMVTKFNTIDYTVNPKTMEVHGDAININMVIELPAKYVDKKSIMKFTPVLVKDNNIKKLKTIIIQGEEISQNGITIGYATGGEFKYQETIDYDESFQNASLYATAEVTIGSNTKIIDKFLITEGIITTSKRIINNDQWAYSKHGYEKETILSKSATVYFLVNQANIRQSEKVGGNISDLKSFMQKNNKTHSIEIISYASPEGSIDFNSDISDKRKEQTFNYVKRELMKMKVDGAEDDAKYKLVSKGEDWAGFNNLVSESNMKDKQSVLNIVNSIKDKRKREEAIRDMSVIFETIEKDVLPKLRKAEIKINAYQPKKTDEEIKKLSMENPSELTIEELLYSATLERNNAMNIYNFTIEHFPNDYRAYNNIGCLTLRSRNPDRDTKQAKIWFEKSLKIKKNDDALMNLAILSITDNDLNAYNNYFEQVNNPQKYNTGMYNLRHGNYKYAIDMLDKDTYNYTLAKVLSGDYNVSCNDNSERVKQQCNYLNAIIGARKGEQEAVLKYLDNKENKEKALQDFEFKNYWDIIK